MKILIRKAKTESSLKKDILTNLTLSKNFSKIQNVFSTVTCFSANPRNSWIYSKTLEKNILKKELRKAQIAVCGKIVSSVLKTTNTEMQLLEFSKTSFKLSEKHKFLNFLTFHALGRVINPQYKNYSSQN